MRAKELIHRRREAAADRLKGPRRALAVGVAAVKGIYRTGRGVGRWSERRSRLAAKPPNAALAAGAFAAGAAIGAGAGYLLARRSAREAGAGRTAEDLNDPALARKVESEIFRAPDAPKDRVDVNVADRVVYLRGTLEDADRSAALARSAASIEGVKRVENLIVISPATGETTDIAEETQAQ